MIARAPLATTTSMTPLLELADMTESMFAIRNAKLVHNNFYRIASIAQIAHPAIAKHIVASNHNFIVKAKKDLCSNPTPIHGYLVNCTSLY